MALPFLDTSVILRHLTQDSPPHTPRARAMFDRIASGEMVVTTADTVIFETTFTLQSFYRLPRPEIANAVLPLIALPAVRLSGKLRFKRAFTLYVSLPRLSFADCYHLAVMESRALTTMISFDRGFDRVPTVVRVEPDIEGRVEG